MAKVIRKISNLKRNVVLSLQKSAGSLLAMLLVLGAMLYLFDRYRSWWLFTLMIPALIFFYLIQHHWKKFHIYWQGYSGEKEVIGCLKKLSDEYRVYTSVVLRNHYGKKETDQIVVGRTGIFVLETKNYRGEVTGKGGIEPWSLFKTSKAGRRYEHHISSPVRQIREQLKVLQSLLYNSNIQVEAQGIVVFGKETLLHAEGLSETLVGLREGGCERLLDEITKNRQDISPDTLEKIHKLMESFN